MASGSVSVSVGRNDPCPCGSGKKYKHCCQSKETSAAVTPEIAGEAQRRFHEFAAAARAHVIAGRAAQAIPLLREMTRIDPRNAGTLHDLGVLYLRCDKFIEAAECLSRAAVLRPGDESILRQLVFALEPLGDEEKATVVCRKLSRVAADPLEKRLYAAKAFLKEGKFDEGEKELRRLIALAPRHATGRLFLAQLLLSRGVFEEAANHLAVAVETVPSAFPLLTSARKMTEADRPLAERMRAAVAGSTLSMRERSDSLRARQDLRRCWRLFRGDAALRSGQPTTGRACPVRPSRSRLKI